MLKLQAIGYLGNDVVVRETGGKKVMNFSIAHTEKYKDAQGVINERTTWVECSLWERENLAPYLKKGQQVWVEGMPSVSAYTSKSNEVAASLKMNVFHLELLGGQKKDNAQPNAGTSNGGNSESPGGSFVPGGFTPAAPTGDGLPF